MFDVKKELNKVRKNKMAPYKKKSKAAEIEIAYKQNIYDVAFSKPEGYKHTRHLNPMSKLIEHKNKQQERNIKADKMRKIV
jgi:hypothetical protein